MPSLKERVINTLVSNELITPEQLQKALKLQQFVAEVTVVRETSVTRLEVDFDRGAITHCRNCESAIDKVAQYIQSVHQKWSEKISWRTC